MIKIKNFNLLLLIIFLSTYGCGFKPSLTESNLNFSIKVDNKTGNEAINSKIENQLKILNGIKKIFKLDINSSETKNILSKDSKGDPAIMMMIIKLNYNLIENSKILVNRTLIERKTYNNISDKFDLRKSEEILRDNLVENFIEDIINSASNLIENPMINDN